MASNLGDILHQKTATHQQKGYLTSEEVLNNFQHLYTGDKIKTIAAIKSQLAYPSLIILEDLF